MPTANNPTIEVSGSTAFQDVQRAINRTEGLIGELREKLEPVIKYGTFAGDDELSTANESPIAYEAARIEVVNTGLTRLLMGIDL